MMQPQQRALLHIMEPISLAFDGAMMYEHVRMFRM